MAVAGGAASVITQVQQQPAGGVAPISTSGLGGSEENITLELRGTRFTLSRDELLTLPEFVLLSLFPNGLLPDGHMSNYHDTGDVYPVDVSNNTPSNTSTAGAGTSKPLTQASSTPIPVTAHQIVQIMRNAQVYLSDMIYPSQYDPTSLQYMLEFFRHVASSLPTSAGTSPQDASTVPIEPAPAPLSSLGTARDMLQDRAGIIVLREDLDFYAIPPRRDIESAEMIEIKRAAGRELLKQDGIFSGLRKSEEEGTTERHLIEMLTAGGFDHADTWGHRAAEPNKAVICSIALARLRTEIKPSGAGNTAADTGNAVGMAQKLLLFWRKPARRCWWEGVELDDVEGAGTESGEDAKGKGKLKVWIRRVWTLEMSVIGLR